MPITQETSQEIFNRIEGVASGETFAAVDQLRFYGDVNPNYTREFISRTNYAVRSARCLFKIADVIERGAEEKDLYFGVPYRTSLSDGNSNEVELSENFEACGYAEMAKLLNSKEVTKDDITRNEYELSYHGNKLVEKYSSEMAFATPIIETNSCTGCLGSLAITAGSVYLADKLGHEVFDFSKTDAITDVALHTSFAFQGLLFSRLVKLLNNDFKGNLRAKRVHQGYLEYTAKQD